MSKNFNISVRDSKHSLLRNRAEVTHKCTKAIDPDHSTNVPKAANVLTTGIMTLLLSELCVQKRSFLPQEDCHEIFICETYQYLSFLQTSL